MRIGQHDEDRRQKRLKPPPNYSSRSMQLRLLAMVALLMLVITAAFEARNPDRWKWLWELDQAAPPQEEIDPRLPASASAASDDAEPVVGDSLPKRQKIQADTSDKGPISAQDRAWAAGWHDVFERLSFFDRTQVYDLLQAAREKRTVDDAATRAAEDTLRRLEQEWADYRAAAASGLEGLSDEEQAAWQKVIDQLEQRWEAEARPALEAVAQQEELSESLRTSLAGLQDLLDRLQLRSIQDNTVWRASEREIWFRLLGKLKNRSPEELKRESEGLVGYAQLFKQSSGYRGRLVTIRGTAEAVYPVEAPRNSYGIEQYWVYWLRPEGGPNSPILVYALEKPEGFPSIELADLGREKMPSLQDVEVTGFFFKRYAYQAQGGIFTAPMLLARGPKWLSPAAPAQEFPPLGAFLGMVAALAALAIALAAWVHYQHRPGRIRDAELPDTITIK
jgi:hypothetical protein